MANSDNLRKAKENKNDEFYTQLNDIEAEISMHDDYVRQFQGKVVFCNCDDPEWSNFFKFFRQHFKQLGLKKLITTHFNIDGSPSYKLEWSGDKLGDDTINMIRTPLQGDGDFRSEECIEILKEADIVVTNPPFSCYSRDTEVMTNHGWKLIKDVNIDEDVVMSLNPETKAIEMVKAVDFICSPVKGNLFRFSNRNMDFCVTGNHRMLCYCYDSDYRRKKLLPLTEASDIKAHNTFLPLSDFNWKGDDAEYFILPGTKQIEQYTRKEIEVPDKKIKMEDWLEFFGFWLADGCYRDHINSYGKRDYSISLKQNKSNEQYVLDLIKRIGFKYEISGGSSKTNCNYNIYSKQLWEYLSQFGRSKDKYIPRNFLDLDTKYLMALWTGYTNGDGSISKKDGCNHFSSVSKQLIDNLQEIILKLYGRVAQVRKKGHKHSYDDNYGTWYTINIKLDKNRDNYTRYNEPEMVSYDDKVYCLTLERNHVMLTRHNGVIGWCGNCFREYVAQLMEYDKKFVIIGNKNAIAYKEVFPLLKEGKMFVGYNAGNGTMHFATTVNEKDGNIGPITNSVPSYWYTNLDLDKSHEPLILTKNYNEERYPRYDNYDAIECGKVSDIPKDYYGVIGVPITYLAQHCFEQFKILGLAPERLAEGESSLQVKRYKNAVQHNDPNKNSVKSGKQPLTQGGNKVNDGPVLRLDNPPNKYPWYTSPDCPEQYLQVLYARILIQRKKRGV